MLFSEKHCLELKPLQSHEAFETKTPVRGSRNCSQAEFQAHSMAGPPGRKGPALDQRQLKMSKEHQHLP